MIKPYLRGEDETNRSIIFDSTETLRLEKLG